jgi:preprotein translocase subunit SecD
MRRSLWVSLIGIVAVAAGSLAATLAAGHAPLLGLDLQGGASVVLQPKGQVKSGTLDQAIAIIRNRVDALGVAEPDIHREGSNIIVQLPGVKNQEKALEIVGQTAELRFRPVLEQLPPEAHATTTTAPATTAPPATSAPGTGAPTTTAAPPTTAPGELATTPPEQDRYDATVVLPERERAGRGAVVARYQLGPALAKGTIIRDARAQVNPQNGQWIVEFQTTSKGRTTFCDMTTQLNGRQMAIVLDHVVISAPTVRQPICDGRGIIEGRFTQRDAKDLALVLRYGSLPVELKQATVQTVSPTLGRDSLHAGIVAGVLGLSLVALYMILYYRALGIVVILGLGVSGALMWSLVAFLGETRGLALTLAGAVGLIVSVGVTVDSYVVYFERLKDEIRSGKTVRSSVERGFSRAYRTIIAADLSSFIGAALLYLLTVGSVRGFAFFLGLSTLLDLVVAYFFTRPMVALLGRNRLFTEARFFGVARGLAARPVGGEA